MAETELKPCPFCGETEDIDYGLYDGTLKGSDYVQCQMCGAEIRANRTGNFINAAKLWNKRAENVRPEIHGKWVKHVTEDGYFSGYDYSMCGTNYIMPSGISNYCPNCGAKMNRKEDEIEPEDC